MVEKGKEIVKVLVTGGAGYVGGTVAGLLKERGHEPVILDNFCHAQREMLPAGIPLIEADVADRPLIENLFAEAAAAGQPFDGVMHFAALIEVAESMRKPELYFRNNTASTLSLLEAMLAQDVRKLVFSSTAALYGNPEVVPIPEDACLAPTNAYGESKLLAERIFSWFHQIHGLRYASLRYFNVAGAPETPLGIVRGEAHEPESHLIPIILDVALGRRESLNIYGDDYPTPDGTCIRDYIHVSDLAEAHLLAFEALDRTGADGPLIFNLGNGQGFSVQEVVESARRVTGHPIPAVMHHRRAGDPAALVASSAKAARELEWRPRYDKLDEIMRTAWVWHQKRYA
jgi:UDP-glucose 4-epimerase